MPNMDRTGPRALGPLTGRGLGVCGSGIPRRFARGFGRGFGYGRLSLVSSVNNEPLTKTEEKKLLEEDLKELESERKEINKRLKELD